MLIFGGVPGRVLTMADPAVQGLLPALVATDPPLSFQERKSLITRLTLTQEGNYQFLHTLGGDIYIYVFGDRMGAMTLSGLCVSYDCDQGADREHGFEKMLQWYKENRLAARREPVTVMLGRTPLSGFVTGLAGGVVDPKLNLMQFDLSLMVPPEKD